MYRYAAAFAALGLEKYLRHEQPGYWGLLTSAQLAHLCHEVNQTLYPDCAALLVWVQDTFQVSFSRSGLTDLLHRLGFSYKLTRPLPCEANAAAQTAFLDQLAALEAEVEAGQAVLYYADAAHPTAGTIYVVCDNARYYKNKELTAWLADKPLVQVFLPPYSPNLNLIERLWKYLRQKTITTTFYRTKGQFRQAVPDFFSRLPEFEHDLASLLTRN